MANSIKLDNMTCVYCGRPINAEPSDIDHVIGRRFVPRGKLKNKWNLQVRAHKSCNRIKSDLEDDISAITMQPDVAGRYARADEVLVSEAMRKARSSSRRTGKPVKESSEELVISGSLRPGLEMTVKLTGPPQIDSDRILELSRLHIMAFFYWVTYNPDSKTGTFLPVFYILGAPRSDWGNLVHRAFMDAVVDWEPRVLGIGASGFFKIAIRRHPSAECEL